jgi:hypothetical protein
MGAKRFEIFCESHFGLGIRWRRSVYYSGYDFSVAFPFFTVVYCSGKLLEDHDE